MKKKPFSISSTVYLVGSGPGDPGLLTLHAHQLLQEADLVLYDHLVNPEILKHCSQAKLDYVGKIGHGHAMPQEKIIRRIRIASKKYRKIIRLKGGDPFLFGRGGEEAEALATAGIAFEVVPGVSSALAVPAYAGIPLTHRDFSSALRIVTGHEACKNLAKRKGQPYHPNNETLVMLMAVKNLKKLLEELQNEGLSPRTPAAILEWGTYPKQRSLVSRVENLSHKSEAAGIKSPAIVVIGKVVELRKKLNWFENKPLFAKKILNTRPAAQAEQFSAPLRRLGAEVMEVPSFQIKAMRDLRKLDIALRQIQKYDWLLFSSVNAVDFFFERMKHLGQDIRMLQGVKIASVGPSTSQAITQRMLKIHRQAKDFSSDSLARTLSTQEIRNKKILFPRAEIARANIVEDLQKRGAKLDLISIYRSEPLRHPPKLWKEIFKVAPHLLTFTSSLGVQYFWKSIQEARLTKIVRQIPCAVLGPTTKESAESLGLNVVAMPKRSTMEDFIEVILNFLKLQQS